LLNDVPELTLEIDVAKVDVDENDEQAAKRNAYTLNEILERERIAKSLTDKEFEEHERLLEEAEIAKNLDEEGEIDHEVIESLIKLKQIEEVDNSLALVIFNLKKADQEAPISTTSENINEHSNKQVVTDEARALIIGNLSKQ